MCRPLVRCCGCVVAMVLLYSISLAWTWGLFLKFRWPSEVNERVALFLLLPVVPGTLGSLYVMGLIALILLLVCYGCTALCALIWRTEAVPIDEAPPGGTAVVVDMV